MEFLKNVINMHWFSSETEDENVCEEYGKKRSII